MAVGCSQRERWACSRREAEDTTVVVGWDRRVARLTAVGPGKLRWRKAPCNFQERPSDWPDRGHSTRPAS
jgi:hypothetical protein